MKALVYHGAGEMTWEEVPDPKIIEPTDAIVKIDTTTICGTDLHIMKGDVAAVTDGRILGHEAVGTVVEIGEQVHGVAVGDKVMATDRQRTGIDTSAAQEAVDQMQRAVPVVKAAAIAAIVGKGAIGHGQQTTVVDAAPLLG